MGQCLLNGLVDFYFLTVLFVTFIAILFLVYLFDIYEKTKKGNPRQLVGLSTVIQLVLLITLAELILRVADTLIAGDCTLGDVWLYGLLAFLISTVTVGIYVHRLIEKIKKTNTKAVVTMTIVGTVVSILLTYAIYIPVFTAGKDISRYPVLYRCLIYPVEFKIENPTSLNGPFSRDGSCIFPNGLE